MRISAHASAASSANTLSSPATKPKNPALAGRRRASSGLPRAASVALFAANILVSFAVLAAPAPWFKWKSKLDGKIFCAQTAPGQGWEKHDGPYMNARCEHRAHRDKAANPPGTAASATNPGN